MTASSQRRMWAYLLERPGQLVRREVPVEAEPGPGEVLVRVEAGGICGSDLPKFLTGRRFSPRDEAGPGFPMHEIAGTVVRSEDPRFRPGDAVCGCMPGQRGLAELVRVPADTVVPVPDGFSKTQAVLVQPLSTVLYALDRLPDVRGRSAAVIGLGPIGLLFCHVLRRRGARVTGIDPVDRSAVAATFGIDELFVGSVADWIDTGEPAEIVIEAVGHQTETITQAIRGTALLGHLYAFGVPDDLEYALPFREAFDRAITLYLGVTQEWNGALTQAAGYLADHRELLPAMITHVLGPDAVNDAYTLCAGAAPDRLKVIIDLARDRG